MSYKYEDVLDANESNWLAQLKSFIDKGKQVVVVHIKSSQMMDCYAYAQEHDFTLIGEDQGEYRELVSQNFPEVMPTKLGFVHRDSAKRISN